MEQAIHQPKRQRSCAVCGKVTGKTELFRVVRGADGSVSFDKTGKAPGRGAYVCSEVCLEDAGASKRLSRTLRTALSLEDYQRIADDLGDAIREVTE